jgi:flagellar motor switch protein FliG
MQSLADLDTDTLARCLRDMDSHDLTLAVRQMEADDREKIFEKVDEILGSDYAEILRMAVLQADAS